MSKKTESILDAFKISQEKNEIKSSRKLKVGIIGTGWIASAHAYELKQMEDVEITCLADIVPGKAEQFAKDNGIEGARYYLSHKELLDNEEVDAVTVCTYNTTHAECSIYALEKGVNVLCEKPMCVTLEEAINMHETAKRTGKILSIGFQPRLDPNMKKIKEIVESGLLGKIYYIQTGGGRRSGIPYPYGTSFIDKNTAGIGAMGDIGCYSLDMVLNAVGYPKPLTVTGYKSDFFGKNPKTYPTHPEYAEVFGVDDFAAGFIRLEGDIILDFRISWDMHLDTPGDTFLLGTEGALRIPSTDCWNGTVGGPMKVYSKMAGSNVETEIPILPPLEKGCFYEKIRSFLDAIITGGKAPVPSEQIVINQAIIDGIVKSAEIGQEIKIELPEL